MEVRKNYSFLLIVVEATVFTRVLGNISCRLGFDHGAGHPLLFLDDAKAPNCRKNNGFSDLGNYSEWPKVAGAVIQARYSIILRYF